MVDNHLDDRIDTVHCSLRTIAKKGIDTHVYSGAVILNGSSSDVRVSALGTLTPEKSSPAMHIDVLFDLASVSKVLGTWSAVGLCLKNGVLELGTSVGDVYPETVGKQIGTVTVEQLLTHTAGVKLRSQLKEYGTTREEIERGVMMEDLVSDPGTVVQYTDRAALMLGFLAERASGRDLVSLTQEVWDSLGCPGFCYGPISRQQLWKTVPGGFDDHTGVCWHGVAHDLSTRLLGGVSGIAGCFGTAMDVARFLKGVGDVLHEKNTALSLEFVRASVRCQTGTLTPRRGYGWAISEEGLAYHFGFTGSALWFDAATSSYAGLFTNRLLTGREREPLLVIRNTCAAAFWQYLKNHP